MATYSCDTYIFNTTISLQGHDRPPLSGAGREQVVSEEANTSKNFFIFVENLK